MRDRKAFHFIAAIALFAAMCSTQGCSVRYRFIIVNASDDEVTVVYSLRPEWTRVDGRGPQYTVERLLEISVAELRNREALWQSVPADRVSFDDAGGKVTVRLGASMALHTTETLASFRCQASIWKVRVARFTSLASRLGTTLSQRTTTSTDCRMAELMASLSSPSN